ncbi:BCL2 like 16 [Latimeria chalumnae]|uniref:Bcl-2 Bcl-2 homology region 1-3 domain-containing protein n=1 Tax=Latimeria chalumnae TaxID=7897 RepID=H3A443_LATCH|nr:PREDICTED: bcl-2-related ovarian killer protein homolog A-like [Latimeria chalumnae]|eukprot:XP_006001488.1 PREDICTED: bcl-2-related ovarian killer protein homolog A-like [Latimeria chalumnae]
MALAHHEDPVVKEAYLMLHDYIAYVTGRKTSPAPSKAAAALRYAGDDLLEKFPIFFKRWPRLFSGVSEDKASDLLLKILDDHFKPQQAGRPKEITWSGILSIYIVAGQMAIYCQENGMEGVLESLAMQVGQYVEKTVCPFIREKGGWVGFTTRYAKKEDAETKVLKVCCGTLLTLAMLSLLYYTWNKRLTR